LARKDGSLVGPLLLLLLPHRHYIPVSPVNINGLSRDTHRRRIGHPRDGFGNFVHGRVARWTVLVAVLEERSKV
jgi:hypothetical protein